MNGKLTTILTSLCISPALLFSSFSRGWQQPNEVAAEETTYAETSPRTQRVEVKHIEDKGVGYDQGYSTLEGFFTIPSTLDGSWVPFLDIRGHIFNDGKPAVNGGMGLRYLAYSRVWGLNTYYDYRKTHKFHYNQVGFGLESLGEIWDFRLNAYVPVGKKDSHLFHTHFSEFKHHSIILSSKKEIAMKGANAEAAAHVLRKENYKLYVAAGPYYFEHEGRVAWGGEGRVALTLFDYLRLQVSGSGDKVFHGIVQGEAALVFSFGGKRPIKLRKNSCDDYCSQRAIVEERALQRVDRNEMIVVTKKHHKSKAVDPDTGHAYKVWFINNTSHSQGTFESPFNTLVDAQNSSGNNDIIYVFIGDGTDQGMNAGITLKKGQQLLGAGIGQYVDTTRGTVHIPAHGKGMPMISNTNAPAVFGTFSAVTMNAGDNVVSGLICVDNIGKADLSDLSDQSAGIRIDDGLNYLIQNNIVSTFSNPAGIANIAGIGLNIFGGGNVSVKNNTFLARDGDSPGGGTVGIFMFPISAPHQGDFLVANNLFTGVNASSGLSRGIALEPQVTGAFGVSKGFIGNLNMSVVGNTCNSQTNISGDPNQAGILVSLSIPAAQSVLANISDNHVIIPAGLTSPLGGIAVKARGPGPLNLTVHDNVSLTPPAVPGYYFNTFGNLGNLNLDLGFDNVGSVVIIP